MICHRSFKRFGAFVDEEITGRMAERAPDVTRLIDRLEKQGLVERDRSDEDRRLSVAKISRTGLELLDRMEPELTEANRQISEKNWINISKTTPLTSDRGDAKNNEHITY